jgi:putative chitinase
MRIPADWELILRQIAPNGKDQIIRDLADVLPALCDRYAINTSSRMAHFLAQICHESDHFKTTVEYASGDAYEGRKDLGNIEKGDGRRFKGRGLIQLTGRNNYEKAGWVLHQDFVADPEMVARFPHAADVAGWYWHIHELNHHADRDDVKRITKIINGGLIGLQSRQVYLKAAKSALA